MAKRKVRPHPGVLTELLKSKNMTQNDVASNGGVDRKTQAKINRGEEVKLETLRKLANKLKVPITYFDPPGENSVSRVKTKPEWLSPKPEWLSLKLRKVNAEYLTSWLICPGEPIEWKLNVHSVDDEAISLLEQFDDAVKDLSQWTPLGEGSLRPQLGWLKKTKHVASLLEELAKHGLAVFAEQYLSWQSERGNDNNNYPCINYESSLHLVLSIEEHTAHERHVEVWQGIAPPKFAPDFETIVYVDGLRLERDPVVTQGEKEDKALNKETEEKLWSAVQVEGEQKASSSDTSSGDRNAQ
jgi:transcriptional regulator with XRE-family HTH domain